MTSITTILSAGVTPISRASTGRHDTASAKGTRSKSISGQVRVKNTFYLFGNSEHLMVQVRNPVLFDTSSFHADRDHHLWLNVTSRTRHLYLGRHKTNLDQGTVFQLRGGSVALVRPIFPSPCSPLPKQCRETEVQVAFSTVSRRTHAFPSHLIQQISFTISAHLHEMARENRNGDANDQPSL